MEEENNTFRAEKRQRRQEKNREAAKMFRKRKKHYIEFIEKKVKILKSALATQELRAKGEEISGLQYEHFQQTCAVNKEKIHYLIEEMLDVMLPMHAKLLLMLLKDSNTQAPELTSTQHQSILELLPTLAQEKKKLQGVVELFNKVRQDLGEVLEWANSLPPDLIEDLQD